MVEGRKVVLEENGIVPSLNLSFLKDSLLLALVPNETSLLLAEDKLEGMALEIQKVWGLIAKMVENKELLAMVEVNKRVVCGVENMAAVKPRRLK